jgi:hypothetical protein
MFIVGGGKGMGEGGSEPPSEFSKTDMAIAVC